MANGEQPLNYVDLYNQLNQSLIIKIPHLTAVSLTFSDLSTNISNNAVEFADIYNKLNSIFQMNTNMKVFTAYKSQLIQITVNICNDINMKLADGVLEPSEIVEFVANSLNTVTEIIANQIQELKDNKEDIKNLVTHYVLSLMIVILSALETTNIISKDSLKPTLDQIDKIVSEIQLVNQIANNVAKINSNTNGKCCVIS